MKAGKNYYEILGVDEDVPSEQLKKSYHKLVKRYHPDTTKLEPDDAKRCFLEITEAFETLSNPRKKREYDSNLKESKRIKRVSVLKQKHKREDELWVERQIEESLGKESHQSGVKSRVKDDTKPTSHRGFLSLNPFRSVPQDEVPTNLRSFELPLPLELRLKLILSLIGILTLPLFVLLFSITSTLLSLKSTGSLLSFLFTAFIIYWLISLMYLMTGFFRDKNEFYRLYRRQLK